MRGETVGPRSVATVGWGEVSRRAAAARSEGSPHLLGEPNGGARRPAELHNNHISLSIRSHRQTGAMSFCQEQLLKGL